MFIQEDSVVQAMAAAEQQIGKIAGEQGLNGKFFHVAFLAVRAPHCWLWHKLTISAEPAKREGCSGLDWHMDDKRGKRKNTVVFKNYPILCCKRIRWKDFGSF